MIDVNVIRLCDTIIMKQPSLMQTKFERRQIKLLYDKAIPHFSILQGIDKKKCFYVIDDEFEGLLSAGLPEFWDEKVSKSFANF